MHQLTVSSNTSSYRKPTPPLYYLVTKMTDLEFQPLAFPSKYFPRFLFSYTKENFIYFPLKMCNTFIVC